MTVLKKLSFTSDNKAVFTHVNINGDIVCECWGNNEKGLTLMNEYINNLNK